MVRLGLVLLVPAVLNLGASCVADDRPGYLDSYNTYDDESYEGGISPGDDAGDAAEYSGEYLPEANLEYAVEGRSCDELDPICDGESGCLSIILGGDSPGHG